MDDLQFANSRRNMVDCQLRPNKVTDERVLDAFGSIPREQFVSRSQRAVAYVDEDLPLSGGRSMMEPMVLSRLVQALEVQAHHSVLIVGGSTGYAAAIMARLADSVISIEARAQLVEKSQEILVACGLDNAVAVKGRLTDGFAKEAPYQRILIEGSVEAVPDMLLDQLSPDGLLAAVWRPAGHPVGVASLWSRSAGSFARKPLFDAQVPRLDEFRTKREFVF